MMKIVSAAAMLAVSASMLGTSTYAWFSMNKAVSAEGISLTATVPTQLLIKGSATNAVYKSAIDFTDDDDSAVYNSAALTDLYPVAYKSRSAAVAAPTTFKKLITTEMDRVDVNGQVDGAVGDLTDTDTFTAATANNDYFTDTFTVMYAGQIDPQATGLKLTITVTDSDTSNTASNIEGALHVVLVDDKDTANVFDLDMGSATAASSVYTLNAGNLIDFTADNEQIEYTIYVFYDGEDADCKNSNAVNMDDYSFELEFELVDTSPASP